MTFARIVYIVTYTAVVIFALVLAWPWLTLAVDVSACRAFQRGGPATRKQANAWCEYEPPSLLKASDFSYSSSTLYYGGVGSGTGTTVSQIPTLPPAGCVVVVKNNVESCK